MYILISGLASNTLICYALVASDQTLIAIYNSLFFYLLGFLLLYVKRRKYFGFFLLMSLSYGLLFGIPSVAWVLTNSLKNPSQVNFLLGIFAVGNVLALLSYCESMRRRNSDSSFTFKPNEAFVAVLVAVSVAQVYKLYAYFGVLNSSEYGHLAIWIDGEALLSAVPSWIRVVSGGSLLIGIIGVALFRKQPVVQLVFLLLIASDLVIGIRNKGFFGTLAAIYILSLFDRNQASRIFQRISSVPLLALAFFLLSVVSFLREGYEIPLSEYFVIVLDSLASIVNALLITVSEAHCISNLDGALVFSQFWTLMGLGAGDQISGQFNYCFTGNPNPLTSVSSSLIFELMLLTGALWPIAVILYFLLFYTALKFFEKWKTIFGLSILCMLAPALLYTLRAEILQPLVYLIKSFPYMVLIGLLVKRTSRLSYSN